jgi:DNA polymerase elongation subunit (family B)
MSNYKVPLETIEKFLHGWDDEKYIVNIEFDQETNTIFKIIDNPETGQKSIVQDKLTSFMWIKNLNEVKAKVNQQINGKWVNGFYGGSDAAIKKARLEHGIEIKSLKHDDNMRLANGFKYLVTCTQGHARMLNFFKEGGLSPYDSRNGINTHFLILKPVEQYLIGTGKRLFKGFEDYNQIHKLVFDLETTGLDPATARIFLIGMKDNRGFEHLIKTDLDDESERDAIMLFFALINRIRPSLIGGYNSANFDWPFIWKRCEVLGLDITQIAKTLKENIPISKTAGTLKLGGEVEDYEQVHMWGYSVIDIIHSARRAQAIDSDMKSASLKYVTKYNKVAKKNRVYVPGENNGIARIWKDADPYFFCDRTGAYAKTRPKIEYVNYYTRDMAKANPDKIFVFGDNEERVGMGGQAKELRGEPNAIGIVTKARASHNIDAYWSDVNYEENKKKVLLDVAKVMDEMKKGKTIVLPAAGIGTGLAELSTRAPRTLEFINGILKQLETYAASFQEVSGEYIIKRYLMDDLWETMEVDNIYNQTGFMLVSMVPTTYQRILTMGTAGLWKMLMLTWSYENDLAVPVPDVKRDFVGGLSRLFKTGFSTLLRKMDFNSLYPAIQLAHDVFPSVDISGAMKSMLKYFHRERFAANDLSKKYKKEGNETLSAFYKRKQLPLKIFINSMFGALGAPQAFPWAEINVSERVTCIARQYLRLMVRFYMNRGYTPLVLDTDGVNFMAPKGGDEHFRYIGKGNHKDVVAGKEYKGVEAVAAEFNDLYMKGEMGLGLDGVWPSTLNFARKNYALFEDGKVKKTGNSIKSKKIPTYIEEFLDKALVMLLEGRGRDFVDYYYDYVHQILNKEIPLAKIATKSKVKKSIEAYKNRGTNINGAELPKQAHMELAMANHVQVSLGDVLYYINVADKKAATDVGTHKVVEINAAGEKVEKEVPNCILLDPKTLENQPDLLGTYNVPRYLEMFNKKIEPLLICFDKLIRDKILIEKDPSSVKKPKEKKKTKKEMKEIIISKGWQEDKKLKKWVNYTHPMYDYQQLTVEEAYFFENGIDTELSQRELESRGEETKRVVVPKPEFMTMELELVNGQPFEAEDEDTLEEFFTPSQMEEAHWNQIEYNPFIWKDDTAKFTVPGLGFEREIL